MDRFHKKVPKNQKLNILSEHFKSGVSISELSRKYQIQAATLYKWREQMKKKEEVLDPKELLNEIERLKSENSRLKHTVADQALDITTLKQWNEFMKKKLREEKLNIPKSSSKREKS